ncbi:OpgC domain-containing protein, partial [Salmonella enterica subsp. enterica serovar Corvallis]
TRLAHILAIAYVIVSVPAISNLARTPEDHPLAILGKHSLPVFVAGTILAMVAQIVKVMNPGDELDDTLLIASGIMAQFALAHYLEWLPSIGWGNARPAQQQVQPVKSKLVIAGRPVNAAAMSSGMKSGTAKSAVS